jgi:hypothetical protein
MVLVRGVVRGHRDDLEVDRREVGQDAVEMGRVADVADEAGRGIRRVVPGQVDGEVVEEGRPRNTIS